MTAVGLLALWVVAATVSPPRPDELDAVARLHFEQAARLPERERLELFRILDSKPKSSGGQDRQEGPDQWWH